jgi:hypothetical protein
MVCCIDECGESLLGIYNLLKKRALLAATLLDFFAANPIMASKSAAFRSKTLYFFCRRQFPNRL